MLVAGGGAGPCPNLRLPARGHRLSPNVNGTPVTPVTRPRASQHEQDAGDAGHAAGAQPSVNGSRVAPVSSTHTDLFSVYSRMASTPFSRPMPLAPNPPKGTCGATTR